MLWLGGAIKQPMVVNKIMNQTDMAATLLAQMGISHEEFSFSRTCWEKNTPILLPTGLSEEGLLCGQYGSHAV